MKRIGFFLLLICLSAAVSAHSIGRSSSDWWSEGRITQGRWAISEGEAQKLVFYKVGDRAATFGDAALLFVPEVLAAQRAGNACALTADGFSRQPNGDIVFDLRTDCAADTIDLAGLFMLAPGHVHLARVSRAGDRFETLITRAQTRVPVSQGPGLTDTGSPFRQYLGLGTFHILEGWDHLAFLMALLLAVRGIGPLIWCITGFTLGHSATLVLGATGTLLPIASVVEPLIAFTIGFTVIDHAVARAGEPRRLFAVALVGAVLLMVADLMLARVLPLMVWAGLLVLCLAMWGRHLAPRAARAGTDGRLPILTTGFGFIHGFGFVGVLADVGLPTEGRVLALLGFNIGVEVGQILFVAAALGLLAALKNWVGRLRRHTEPALASALLSLSVFWLTDRLFFG